MKINKIVFFLIILFIFSHQINIEQDIEISFPEERNISLENINSIIYITINLDNFDEISDEYFRITANSSEKIISPLIILSKNNIHPLINNSDIYSTQKIGDANLILPKVFLSQTLYLSIECNIYPCSFSINFALEKLPVLNPNQIFTYFIKESIDLNMNFKIPSQLNIENNLLHSYDIAVSFSNELLVETELLFDEIKINERKIEKGVIYSFLEENIINKNIYNIIEDNYYRLQIKSKEEQYITISVNSKIINDNKYTNKIIPNKGELFSYMKNDLLKQECYTINTELNDYSNSLIFASVFFFSKPLNYYFLNKNSEKSEINTPLQNSINIVFLKEDNIYKDLCFYLDKETDEGLYKIEISETKDIINKINIYSPLMTGMIYKKSLSINDITYYTFNPFLRNFTQMNFNLKVIKGNIKMFLYTCNNFPYCKYTYEELINNNKVIRPHIVNDMFSYSDYFNPSVKCLSPFGYKQNLMYVYCTNETKDDLCQFEISFFSDKDKILLLNNDKFYQYMLKDEIDLYKINIPLLYNKDIDKIKIILYTFTGEAKYEVIKNNYFNIENEFIGGMDIYEYKLIKDNNIDKEINIEFNIKACTNAYYEVEYKIIKKYDNPDDIENSFFFDEKYFLISSDITYKDLIKYNFNIFNVENNIKYYLFKNNKKIEKKNYFVQIFSLNCEIEVKRDNKLIHSSGKIYQDIINYNEPFYNNDYYIYETKILSAENFGEQDYQNCVIYLSGESINNDNSIERIFFNNKILLTENEPHDIILTKDIKFYNYLFPYLGHSFDLNSFSLVHINFDSKMNIKIKFFFDENSEPKKEVLMGRSGQILLDNELLQENCIDFEEICNIIIQVEFNNENYDKTYSSPNFQLFISTQNKIPSYLKNGELRIDSVVNSNPLQYFYTEISKNSQGEIISYTKRGEGVLYIRIYKKGTIDSNKDWRGIDIPDKDNKDVLYYDNFIHSSRFDTEDTKDCGNKGCLLLITYENIFSPINHKNYLSPFTIMTRLYNKDKTKQSILDIPLKIYTYGIFDSKSLNSNYYRIYFPEHSQRIDFEIQCETCVLYISKNTSLIPNELNYDYKYNSQGKYGVYSLFIKEEEIKGKYYLLNIESNLNKENTIFYSFRVSLPEESNFVNYNIIPVDSDQNAICDMNLKINDGICYFMLYIDDKEFISDEILAHIYTDIDLLDIKMKANFIPKNIAESNDINQIEEYLPDEMSEADFNTENQFYQDYIIIKTNQRPKDNYIIYSVSSEYTATVTFLATFYKYEKNVLSNSNTVQLMKFEKNQEFNLYLSSNRVFMTYIYSLYGEGEIIWKDDLNNTKRHLLTEHEMFSYINYKNDIPVAIKVKSDSNLAFYFWRDIIDLSFYIKEIDFNMREKIFVYNTNNKNNLELKFYCTLPLLKKNKKLIFEDLIFNIQFNYNDINNDSDDININNSLTLYGTLLSLDMINKIKSEKSDDNIIKDNHNLIISKFDLSSNSAYLLLNKTFCQSIWDSYTEIDTNANAYLYISIKTNNKKIEINDDIIGEAIVSFRNNINYIVPNNQVFQTKLEFNNTFSYYLYNLQLDGTYEKNKIILDISTNVLISENNLMYSIVDYDSNNFKKNSTNINIDENKSKYIGGKYHIEFILNQVSSNKYKGIYLCFYSYNELNVNALFKYNSYYSSYQTPLYNIDDNITIKSKENNLIINLNKIEKIVVKENNKIISYPNCEFIIRKFEKNKIINNEDISTISSINSDYEIIYKKFDINQSKTIEIKFNYTFDQSDKFYISILVNLFNENEKFVYKEFDSDNIEIIDDKKSDGDNNTDNKDNEKTEDDNYTVIIIFFVSVFVIAISIGIFVYFYIRKKKSNKDLKEINKMDFNVGKLINEDDINMNDPSIN